MTIVSYRVVNISDAVENLYPLMGWWVDNEGNFNIYEPFNILYEFRDDKPIRIVAIDGGEPEDQTFTRNWSWVAKELTDAWEAGRSYGRHEGYAEGFDDGSEL